MASAYLMLSIYIPNVDPDTDSADDWANALVAIINDERENNGGPDSPCGVGLFPAVQWLRPESMAHLRELSERLRAEKT